MGMTRAELEREVWKHLREKKEPLVYLATDEAGQPRVRPVALVVRGDRLWVASGTRNGKARQVRQNPSVEFCLPFSVEGREGYVRVAGTARHIVDASSRAALAAEMPWFSTYWRGADDASFSLIEIVPTEMELVRPEEIEPQSFYC